MIGINAFLRLYRIIKTRCWASGRPHLARRVHSARKDLASLAEQHQEEVDQR